MQGISIFENYLIRFIYIFDYLTIYGNFAFIGEYSSKDIYLFEDFFCILIRISGYVINNNNDKYSDLKLLSLFYQLFYFLRSYSNIIFSYFFYHKFIDKKNHFNSIIYKISTISIRYIKCVT